MFHRFKIEMEDRGRMLSRVLQALDHAQTRLEALSFTKRDDRIAVFFVVDADDKQLYRIESLLWNVYGMHSIQVRSVANSTSPRNERA